jgi:hypothetical protein
MFDGCVSTAAALIVSAESKLTEMWLTYLSVSVAMSEQHRCMSDVMIGSFVELATSCRCRQLPKHLAYLGNFARGSRLHNLQGFDLIAV